MQSRDGDQIIYIKTCHLLCMIRHYYKSFSLLRLKGQARGSVHVWQVLVVSAKIWGPAIEKLNLKRISFSY